MKLNPFQQAEVNSHKDAELLWVIQATIESFRKTEMKDNTFNLYSLSKKVGKVVSETIAEREGFNDEYHKLTEKEAAECLRNSRQEKYPDGVPNQEWKMEDLIVPFLDSLIYASLLRVRVPLQEPSYEDGYWPFGQEGGFCNPHKLSMMDD